ncbi:Uncharacterized protein SCF082_LOCUS18429, partial [Durusdinium trenchii]
AYCDGTNTDEDGNVVDCGALGANGGTLTIDFDIVDDEGGSCCQTCTCYGDPECVSFNNVLDKWILCDARESGTCAQNKKRCLTQKDHAGNQCAWNKDIVQQSALRSDIAAYGSPCQPQWDKSGVAELLMFDSDRFTATITMGERGVIEELRLRSVLPVESDSPPEASFTLKANLGFGDDPMAAFVAEDAARPVENYLEVDSFEGPGDNERTFIISNLASPVFLRVVVIKHKGQSTTSVTDEVYEECGQLLEDSHQLCRALVNSACTKQQVPQSVEDWCLTANLYPEDPNRVQRCIDEINPTAKNQNKVTKKWINLYCTSVAANRDASTFSSSSFVSLCASEMQNNGYDTTIAKYGTGQLTEANIASSNLCATSETQYDKRTDECIPGLFVEYSPQDGVWEEEFFIPSTLIPCNGKLDVSAELHPNLFEFPIRFRQCQADAATPK